MSLPTTSRRRVCVTQSAALRGTWHHVLSRYLVLKLSAEVKADHMAVLEKQAAGQYVVYVL